MCDSLEIVHSLEKGLFVLCIFLLHIDAKLSALTLIEHIFYDTITVSSQGYISSPLLVDIEFLMMNSLFIYIL